MDLGSLRGRVRLQPCRSEPHEIRALALKSHIAPWKLFVKPVLDWPERFCSEEQAEFWDSGKCRKKLWGRSSRPLCRCLLQLVSAFCCFSSLLSFWLPWIYSPFPFFMEFHNCNLLQLFEGIESTQNEVKRKMIETVACIAAPKSLARLAREEKVRVSPQRTLNCALIAAHPVRARFKKCFAATPERLCVANLCKALCDL